VKSSIYLVLDSFDLERTYQFVRRDTKSDERAERVAKRKEGETDEPIDRTLPLARQTGPCRRAFFPGEQRCRRMGCRAGPSRWIVD
jgi:hypothetical protein